MNTDLCLGLVDRRSEGAAQPVADDGKYGAVRITSRRLSIARGHAPARRYDMPASAAAVDPRWKMESSIKHCAIVRT